MECKRFFLIAVALSSVVTACTILYAKGTIQDMIRFRENTGLFYSSTQYFAFNSKGDDYTGEKSTTLKLLIYLTETEQCLPQN